MRPLFAAIGFRRHARRFADDRCGTAAIEFAILVPTIFALAYGASEISNAIAIERKLTTTARTVSDIVAQATSVSDSDMTNVLSAGQVLLQPYAPTSLKIRVSAVNVDASKKATIVWSDASPASEARAKNQVVTIPDGIALPNTQLIWGEVAYDFKPDSPFGAIKSLWSFTYANNQFFARPRQSTTICRPPTVTVCS